METKTISATYTDTIEHLTYFAIKKGWTEKKVERTFDENQKPVDTEIDNPVTLDQFLTNWAKDLLLEQISDPITQDILEQNRQAGLKQVADTKIQLENSLNVIIENSI